MTVTLSHGPATRSGSPEEPARGVRRPVTADGVVAGKESLEAASLPTARLLVQMLAARDEAEIGRLLTAFDQSQDTVRVELDEDGELASVDVSALLAGAHLALGVAVALGAKGSKTSRRKLVAALHHRLGLAVPR